MTHRLEVTLFIAKHEDLLRSYIASPGPILMGTLVGAKVAMFGDKASTEYVTLIPCCTFCSSPRPVSLWIKRLPETSIATLGRRCEKSSMRYLANATTPTCMAIS